MPTDRTAGASRAPVGAHDGVAVPSGDLGGRKPRLLTRELAERADVVVTMGCGDACPYIPGKRYIDWNLTDPKGRPVDEVRAIRDDIARRVDRLVAELEQAY